MRLGRSIVVSLVASILSSAIADACPRPAYRAGMDVSKFLYATERGIVQNLASSVGTVIPGASHTLIEVAYVEYKLARQRAGDTRRQEDDHFNAMRQFYDLEASGDVVAKRLDLLGKSTATGAVQLIERNRSPQFVKLKDLLKNRPAEFNTISSGFKRAWASECN